VGSSQPQSKESGQALVEFGLVFPVLVLVIMVLLEIGFAFNAYQTVVYAARSGSRAGAVYLYQRDCAPVENDQNRESGTGCAANPYTDNVRAAVVGAMPIARNFDPATRVQISYSPDDLSANPTRGLTKLGVTVTYTHRFITPMFDSLSIDLRGSASQQIEPS
jgi:Flp pilus assembly protein TadG